VGCLLIGLIAGAGSSRGWMEGPVRLIAVTGFLGGFTTFSAFGLEGFALLQQGRWAGWASYVALHLVGGFGMVALGWGVASRL